MPNIEIMEWNYVIDCDERGEFRAHVESDDNDQIEIFSVASDENGLWIVDDGFMKNNQDVDGLHEYLVEMGEISPDSVIYFKG